MIEPLSERKKSWRMNIHIYKHLRRKYLTKPSLDLGSGSYFEDVDYAIDLYDDSAKDYCNFIKHNLCIKPYPLKKKFNTIMCIGTIEYIENREVLISEAYRLLAKNGTFIITLGSIEKYDKWKNYKLPVYQLTPKELKNKLIKVGFKVETYYNSYLNLNYKFLQPLWKLIHKQITFFVCV